MSKELEALEDLESMIEYFTRLDYVEPIVRGEVQQRFKDIYWNKLPHLNIIKQALERLEVMDGELSDGYHTFNQLYYQRCILFAALVRQNKDKSWKSFKHSDGKYCFDKNGEWFIVGIDTPIGSYTYHYEKKYWELFECQELECGKEWDGHTEEDVTRLLSLEVLNNKKEEE